MPAVSHCAKSIFLKMHLIYHINRRNSIENGGPYQKMLTQTAVGGQTQTET
jgi:hypothetical protein